MRSLHASKPVADKRIYVIGQFIKALYATSNNELVEVPEGPNMLPNSGGTGMQLIKRLSVALDVRPKPLGSDTVDHPERPEMAFQHDKHPSGK